MAVPKLLSDELAGLFTTGFLTDDMVDTIVKVVRKHDVEPNTLQVWIGEMPESNGKTNHTVIIHKGDITEGICVYRSEYPGRALYEADSWTWLIGDGCEKPWPHHYDSEAHSGYVAPPSPLARAIKLLEESQNKLYIDTQMKLRIAAFLRECQ